MIKLDWNNAGPTENLFTGGTILVNGIAIKEVFLVKIFDDESGYVKSYALWQHPWLGPRLPDCHQGKTRKGSSAVSSPGLFDYLPGETADIPRDIGIDPEGPAYWVVRGKVELFTKEKWEARCHAPA